VIRRGNPGASAFPQFVAGLASDENNQFNPEDRKLHAVCCRELKSRSERIPRSLLRVSE